MSQISLVLYFFFMVRFRVRMAAQNMNGFSIYPIILSIFNMLKLSNFLLKLK